MRPILTVTIWSVSLLCLAVAGVVATEVALIPVSLDVGDMVTAGVEPWQDALVAAALFAGLLAVTALSLRLWHSVRFKALAVVLTAAEVAAVGWSGFIVYRDYF